MAEACSREGFCRFLFFSNRKGFDSLQVLYFRGLPVQVEFRFHDDATQSLLVAGAVWLHLGPPRQPSGCCGGLSLSHTAPAARRDCLFTPQPCVLGQSVRVDLSKSVSTSPQTQALITTRSTGVEQIRSGKSLGSRLVSYLASNPGPHHFDPSARPSRRSSTRIEVMRAWV